jgi:glucokinase
MSVCIGVDVGGTNLRVGVVDGVAVIDELRFAADFSTICRTYAADAAWQQILAVIAEALRQVLQRHPAVTSIGIGFPGFIDPLRGTVAQSPNLPGLHDADLAGDLARLLQRPVVVENDALAAAYGEYRLHADSIADLIYMGLGTGVGGGLIVNHQPFAGQNGYAMEIGHIIVEPAGRPCGCGNRGCMEQYASASGVSLTFQSLTGKQLDAASIAQAASQGDSDAMRAFDLAAESLAQTLAHILKVVDVRTVVIGGGMSHAWPLMQAVFMQRLERDLIPVLRGKINVSVSSSGDHAGIIGAALLSVR